MRTVIFHNSLEGRSLGKKLPRRVLILEDDLALETVLLRVIQSVSNGAMVDWVTSVAEARAKLKLSTEPGGRGYDLIIADIFLEGAETGVDFWQACQFIQPGVPILLISSLGTEQFFKMLGRNVIAPPFLGKPFEIGECRQLIEGLLSYTQAA